jgi:hypothetical protein
MKVAIKTLKEVVKLEEVTEERDYPLAVFPVQYRNYPNDTVHIQGSTKKVNREYGFAFNIKGHSQASDATRKLLSYAGTGQLYWNASLIINGKSAVLVGANGDTFDVPLSAIPFMS